jgi:hypothetical protein
MDRGGVKEVQVSVAEEKRKRHNAQIHRKGDWLLAGTGSQISREIPENRQTPGDGIR